MRAELNQVRALTKNITQAAIDKGPDEVLAFTVRPLSRKQHKTNKAWKQVPLATTTALVVASSTTIIGELIENETSATGTHTTLLGTATITHGAFIGIRNCKAYHTAVAGTKTHQAHTKFAKALESCNHYMRPTTALITKASGTATTAGTRT